MVTHYLAHSRCSMNNSSLYSFSHSQILAKLSEEGSSSAKAGTECDYGILIWPFSYRVYVLSGERGSCRYHWESQDTAHEGLSLSPAAPRAGGEWSLLASTHLEPPGDLQAQATGPPPSPSQEVSILTTTHMRQ